MKVKAKELSGAALDFVVAGIVCPAFAGIVHDRRMGARAKIYATIQDDENAGFALRSRFAPSTEWRDGGPLIERYGVALYMTSATPPIWCAGDTGTGIQCYADVLLTAAMRVIVVRCLGEELDIPDELGVSQL